MNLDDDLTPHQISETDERAPSRGVTTAPANPAMRGGGVSTVGAAPGEASFWQIE
jgi:hypothetical protein